MRVQSPALLTAAALWLAAASASVAQVTSPQDDLLLSDPAAYPPTPQGVEGWAIGLRSFGPIRYGMTVAEAEAAAGVRLRATASQASEDGTCGFATLVGGPNFVEFMVRQDRGWRIMSVTVRGTSGTSERLTSRGRPRTRSGIGIGSSFAEVRRAYPGQVRADENIYGGPDRLAFTARDRADRDFVVLFHPSDGSAVSAISAGYRGWADAPEGCS